MAHQMLHHATVNICHVCLIVSYSYSYLSTILVVLLIAVICLPSKVLYRNKSILFCVAILYFCSILHTLLLLGYYCGTWLSA